MDSDDLTFGASVWATPEPEPIISPPLPLASTSTSSGVVSAPLLGETKRKSVPPPLTLEDDFGVDSGFGDISTVNATTSNSNANEDDFDDFDDFGSPAGQEQFGGEGMNNDDFGDFGDFDAAPVAGGVSFEEADGGFGDDGFGSAAGPSAFGFGVQKSWKPLVVDPVPSSLSDIQDEVFEILEPIWAHEDISRITTDDPMREVEGVGQILVTSSR